MPNKPVAKRKTYQDKRVQHQRTKDMRWFYNDRRWRRFSKAFKVNHPYCIKCEEKGIYTPTSVTDHKLIFELHPAGFDLDNLKEKDMQPLCDKCHASKSGKEAHLIKNR